MWYVENEAVKIFLYYMRGWKKIFCNILIIFHYMTSNNLVKQALGWIVVFHLYMISCNPVKALGKVLYSLIYDHPIILLNKLLVGCYIIIYC